MQKVAFHATSVTAAIVVAAMSVVCNVGNSTKGLIEIGFLIGVFYK